MVALALEKAPAGSVVHGASEEGVPAHEIAEVIGRRLEFRSRLWPQTTSRRTSAGSAPSSASTSQPRAHSARRCWAGRRPTPGSSRTWRRGTTSAPHPSERQGTIVKIVSFGGREVRQGHLVRSRSAAHPVRLTTPEGILGTGSGASGHVIPAWRASTSTLSLQLRLLRRPASSWPWSGRLPQRSSHPRHQAPRHRQDRVDPSARSRHASTLLVEPARVEWSSGKVRVGWLLIGEGTDFTDAVTAEIAQRHEEGRACQEHAPQAPARFLTSDPKRSRRGRS
jgi:hypothetical protein